MRLKDPPLLFGAVAISGLVVVAGRLNGMPELSWVFPTLTIGLIVWAAWLRGRLADHYARFITLGLSLSLLADLLRLTFGHFLSGTTLLLIACLCYLRAFSGGQARRLSTWPMLVCIALAALAVWFVWPLFPAVAQAPTLLVFIPIVLMIGHAAARLNSVETSRRKLAFTGFSGALFIGFSVALFIADTILQALPMATLWTLATYWTGQTLIALSVPVHRPGQNAVE